MFVFGIVTGEVAELHRWAKADMRAFAILFAGIWVLVGQLFAERSIRSIGGEIEIEGVRFTYATAFLCEDRVPKIVGPVLLGRKDQDCMAGIGADMGSVLVIGTDQTRIEPPENLWSVRVENVSIEARVGTVYLLLGSKERWDVRILAESQRFIPDKVEIEKVLEKIYRRDVMGEEAQPGATDNPDDAEHLREDH